ncbi:MAG TPA: hypothetical protein PKN44_13170 [Bacteroidales bacterium]|nr:hypothetical protein [Bacteroidales bacterium]HPS51238.1 hypothetical protein [Bacteroidales bacterium]
MKAIEFTTRLSSRSIRIPENFKPEMESNKGKNTRVILLFDDTENYPENNLINFVAEEFFKGYADSDNIYNNYSL